jgi:hypothetical protein
MIFLRPCVRNKRPDRLIFDKWALSGSRRCMREFWRVRYGHRGERRVSAQTRESAGDTETIGDFSSPMS